MKPKVLFTKTITPEAVVELFQALKKPLPGKVAAKVHSGEAGNQNYLRPEFLRPMIELVRGTVVETNTAYPGERNTTKKHEKLLAEHGWSEHFAVDLLDSVKPDLVLEVPNGRVLKRDYVGAKTADYDSLLVLSHFKGHTMGGYGGAIKQLAIGMASSRGKAWIHSGGRVKSQLLMWLFRAKQDCFLEAMADAATAVARHFQGNVVYINIMCNLSVDCDCAAQAEAPCMKDIGALASLDPVALDQACLDLVKNSSDPGREHFLERVTSRHGEHTLVAAEALGLGSREYQLCAIV